MNAPAKQYTKGSSTHIVFLSHTKNQGTVMDLVDALTGAAGLITGIGGTLYATRKQEKRSDFSELVDRWKTYTDEMSKDRAEIKAQYDILKNQENICAENLRKVQAEVDKLKPVQQEVDELKRKVAELSRVA